MPRPDLTSAPSAPAGAHLPVELLRRYVAGQLPPAEEHAVEAHTLDCPVCADILEGLELQPAAAHEASLATLRQRLHGRVAELATEAAPAEPAVIPLWAWRPLAAAAVLLISLSVVGWLAISRFSSAPNIAARSATESTIRKPATVPTITPAEPAAVTAPEVAAATPAVPASPIRRPASSVPMRRKPVVLADADVPSSADLLPGGASGTMDAAITAPEVAAATQLKATADSQLAAAVASEPAADKARMARAASAPAAVAAASAAPETTRTVQGRITDTAGVPLPGATVLVPGTQTGTSTNADGSFSMVVPATASQLAVSSIGYTTQTRALRPTDSTLALALAPDSRQLSEVVVVRREAPPMLPSIAATPAGGYPALRKYLRDSLDYPQKALDERLEGTVRLQFVVGVDGKLSDFKVVRKVSPECDEEAIRLLQEGPAWFPAVQSNRRIARKVVVDVPFKIVQR
ncbi:TonB family protein [Hymenobacter sp. BT190]|uniref:TonB family protein n=1 Tax=Hymenobacter sp. BT190 TaxID=2763505 RepID=UPI001650EA82|nr:TonB family protein [Hymenobacter sp. BT190]MBC6699970.1 TonB family protein [Hymenobacter sp. BT190]